MGGCLSQTSQIEVSPEHYQRRSRHKRTSAEKSRQLPVKSSEDQAKSLLNLTQTGKYIKQIEVSSQKRDQDEQWIQQYLQTTKGKIIKKKSKDVPSRKKEKVAVNPKSPVKSRRRSDKEAISKTAEGDTGEEFQQFDLIKQTEITVDSIEKNILETEDQTDSLHSTKNIKQTSLKLNENEKENNPKSKDKDQRSRNFASDGSIPNLALNAQTIYRNSNREEVQDFVKGDENVIEGSSIDGEHYSHICLRKISSNLDIEFTLPRSQAGPLIVSILDYDKYAV